MKNLLIGLKLVDGGFQPIDGATGRDIIHSLFGDDFGAPPTVLVIEGTAQDGRRVLIGVPYDNQSEASIRIE